MNFQEFKLDLEKSEEPEIKLPTFTGSSNKARKFQKNIYFCFIDYTKTRDQITNIYWIIEKAREFQKNIYFSALLTTPKP